jgi:predicted AAA+ superfamily ATPase
VIDRNDLEQAFHTGLRRSRVVALISPRQSGKTTIACNFVPINSLNYFDLEAPVSLLRLEEPMTALRDLKDLEQLCVIIWIFCKGFSWSALCNPGLKTLENGR